MKAVLKILEKDVSFELDNLTVSKFTPINRRYNSENGISETFVTGKAMTLITSEMPDDLRDEIESLISSYCGH